MTNTRKTALVQARVTQKLKERFAKALQHEGLTESGFINQKITEFVQEVEQKMNPVKKIAGKQIDIDLDIEEHQGIRSAVQDAVHTLLIESGIDDDDIFQIRVEEEYHVKTGKDALGKPITEAEAYVVLVELTDQRQKIVVDKEGIVRI